MLASCVALLGYLPEKLFGVDKLSLPLADACQLHQDVFVVRLQLQCLLVEGGGFRKEPFRKLMVGNTDVLLDGLVVLAGANVHVAKRVDGVPILRLVVEQADVLRDRSVQLVLADELFRFLQ